MTRHADWSPKEGSLAAGAAVAAPAETASHRPEDGDEGGSKAEPTPYAFELRGIWPRSTLRGSREPSPWIASGLVALIVLIVTLGVVAWINRPEVHRVGDLRVDVLIEGVWRVGKEAVATD